MAVLDGVRCVLFDLDGTLIDSAPDLGYAANLLRERYDLPPLPDQVYRGHCGKGARGMLWAGFGLRPEDPTYDALRSGFLDVYEQVMLRETHPFSGVEPLLEQLRTQGLGWGVMTNKSQHLTRPVVASMSFLAAARVVVCGDSTPHLKPHPAGLLEAVRRLDMPAADCVYVGDDVRDIQAGHAAGMRTVAATWGYLGHDEDAADWGADALIEQPLDLLGLLSPS